MAMQMSDSEWRDFLRHGTRTGKLATVRVDGSPHIAPVWFVVDGDDLVFTTGKATVKGRALVRDGRATLCVDDENPPYAFVTVRGRVRLSEDLDEMRLWSARIAERYVGKDLAATYGDRNAGTGELLVRLPAEKVVALNGITD
jgi:PPOX class probable F420-dependent enzyme